MGNREESVSLFTIPSGNPGEFYLSIPSVTIDGVFGSETYRAVKALQADAGLEETGVVDEATWNVLLDRFLSIDRTVLSNPCFFPL
ncbi:MAG: peptidoglycan-binding domain-containing protein [Evtepia sp.]